MTSFTIDNIHLIFVCLRSFRNGFVWWAFTTKLGFALREFGKSNMSAFQNRKYEIL